MNCKLYTTFYNEPRIGRQQELRLALETNARSFDGICVLSESVHCDVGECRITESRQKYSDLLRWAGQAGPDDISVIANCDITFPPESIEQLKSLMPGEVYALSRYERRTGLHNTPWSQDAWVFRGPPPVDCGDYFFGVPGVDNRFAYELNQLGYRVMNPSRTIVTIHIHASRLRTETNSIKHRVEPPYLLIYPHAMGEQPMCIRIPDKQAFDRQLRIDHASRRVRV